MFVFTFGLILCSHLACTCRRVCGETTLLFGGLHRCTCTRNNLFKKDLTSRGPLLVFQARSMMHYKEAFSLTDHQTRLKAEFSSTILDSPEEPGVQIFQRSLPAVLQAGQCGLDVLHDTRPVGAWCFVFHKRWFSWNCGHQYLQ